MRPDDDATFIIHLLAPVAIIQVHEDHIATGKIQAHFGYNNADGLREQFTLSIHHFFTADFLETPEDRAIQLLDKAWRWYRSYLEWEDKQFDNEKS